MNSPVAHSSLTDHPQLSLLLSQLRHLRAETIRTQKSVMKDFSKHIHLKAFQPSACNMAAYIGLRRHDLRVIQMQLAALGLSSLGRTEGHVLANLDAVIHALEALSGKTVDPKKISKNAQCFIDSGHLLQRQTERLFGAAHRHRSVRIMVTFPSEAASDYAFVRNLISKGMDCARINCAHDTPDMWENMIRFVRQAELETGRKCKVMMDLGGPKLRTSPIETEQGIIHLKPKRNQRGEIIERVTVILDGSGKPGTAAHKDAYGRSHPARLGVNRNWLAKLAAGDKIALTDLRGKPCKLKVIEVQATQLVIAQTSDSIYLDELTPLRHIPQNGGISVENTTPLGAIEQAAKSIMLHTGDLLQLTREPLAGRPAELDENGNVMHPARISCTAPEVFDFLVPGQRVLIDDGHIICTTEAVGAAGALLRVTRARAQGSRLAAEKGINFPDTEMNLQALTDKDMADLDFIVRHADIVGYSFVRSAADMGILLEALAERGAKKLGIVAKIETRQAVQNLPEIIALGAGSHPFGVMIARGDLAVEIGYESLAEIQEEIMWLCESAHVPVVWATQVLESLVKLNMPTRAEVTDAAMAERAECVMLNKGPFVLDAIEVLDHLVARMQSHQTKKTAQMRPLNW